MTRKRKHPQPGDKIIVEWVDIYEQTHEDPARAKLARFRTLAYFVRWQGRGKQRQLVTTTTFDTVTGESYGCCSYPAGCVVDVEVIK